MTLVGAGGTVLRHIKYKNRFKRDRKKLSPDLRNKLDDKLRDLLKNPRPPGLAFEKLQGYRKPDIYTFHITGNYKASLEISGDCAKLRRVGTHNYIDRTP